MDLLKAVLLGIVQGLTEFLPISSSGHLVIFSEILNFQQSGITFEVFLHCGTLVSVVVVFRRELLKMIQALIVSGEVRRNDPELDDYFRWNMYVIVATLPAVVVGLLLKDYIDAIFDSILVTFTMLAFTGVIMVATKFLTEKGTRLNNPVSLIMGVAQAMAIMPGLSRSGSTIFAGMLLGLKREVAARFSFIMSIPAILGAVVLDLKDLLAAPPSSAEAMAIAVGMIAAVISGYLAILLLLSVVRKGNLDWFGYYCLAVSAIGFGWYFIG